MMELCVGTGEVTDWTRQQTGVRFRSCILELESGTYRLGLMTGIGIEFSLDTDH